MSKEKKPYVIYHRHSRRHRWRLVGFTWESSIDYLMESYQLLLDMKPKEKGVTPGYAFIESYDRLALISMAKSTFRRKPEDKRWVIE